jgi:hypothetical protein
LKLFETLEESLNEAAHLVAMQVKGTCLLAVAPWRDNGLSAQAWVVCAKASRP